MHSKCEKMCSTILSSMFIALVKEIKFLFTKQKYAHVMILISIQRDTGYYIKYLRLIASIKIYYIDTSLEILYTGKYACYVFFFLSILLHF